MRRTTTRPLRTHLAILIFLAATTPLVLAGLFTYHHLSGETVDDIKERNLDLARAVAGEVEAFLRSPRYVLANIREMILRPRPAGREHGADAMLVAHLPEASPGQRPGEELFESIYLLDGTGTVVSAGLPAAHRRQLPSILGLDLAHRPFIQQTRRSGTPTWSDTFLSLISGHMSLALAMPVDADQVLVGNLNLALLQQVVARAGGGDRVQVALVDHSGAVVAATDPRVAARRLNVSHLPLVREALGGQTSTRECSLDGETCLGSAAPIRGPGWAALVTQPAAAAFAPLHHTARIAAAAGLAALALAVWVALALARRVSTPLAQLTDHARRAATGEFRFPAIRGPFRELEQLGQTFTEMWEALDARERQLAESESRYRELAELLPQVVFELDLEGRVTYANRHGYALFGVEPEALERGLPVVELVAAEDRERAAENIRRRLRGEDIGGHEYRLLGAGGREVPALIYSATILREGVPRGLRGVMVDITDQKRTEQALRFTQFAMDRLSDAVFFLRPDGGVAYANDAACATLGYPRDELLGLTVAAFDPQLSTAAWPEYFAKVREAGSLGGATQHRSRDGTGRDVEVSANHVTFGGEAFICAVARDLTERRALEEQVRQAQKMEAVGTLASGIAHDFNNLLQAIAGFTELLLLDAAEERTRERLGQIAAAAASAAELVQQILAFSRRRSMERRPVDLNRELHRAAEMLRRTLPKMVQVEEDLAADLWPLSADPTQVEQVVMNLGTNARDAMPAGGLLTLATRNRRLADGEHAELAAGPYVELVVTDSGAGMAPEIRERIFEPFFTTKGVGEGTGLGLASAYGIVKAHQGHLHCDSEPGQGTRFTITLPALPATEAARELAAPAAACAGGDERVLVVDDEELVREFAANALEAWGYAVEAAADGEQALERYRRGLEAGGGNRASPRPFHAVVLDLGMPGMGGRRCLTELLQLDPEARVLVASGYGDTALRREVLDAGAAGFVGKPYRLQELCAALRAVLDGACPATPGE